MSESALEPKETAGKRLLVEKMDGSGSGFCNQPEILKVIQRAEGLFERENPENVKMENFLI